MHFQNKLEQLIDEYLNEPDKKNMQQISISIPEYKGLFFIADSSKFDLTKLHSDFSLAIYFAFNGETKDGNKRKERIANYPELTVFERRHVGRNTIGYYLEMNNDKLAIAKIIGLIIRALSPGINIATVGIEMKRVTWHTLKD